jgi:hypothetical protein
MNAGWGHRAPFGVCSSNHCGKYVYVSQSRKGYKTAEKHVDEGSAQHGKVSSPTLLKMSFRTPSMQTAVDLGVPAHVDGDAPIA